MDNELLEHREGAVAKLILNRAESRNTLTRPMLWALVHSLSRLAADTSIRTVVLTAAGQTFSVGGDLDAFARGEVSNEEVLTFDDRANEIRLRSDAVRWLHEMPKPTLAILPGSAAGAGLALALACDQRIAISTARFSTAFARVGLSGDYGISYFLSRLMSAARARELMFSARTISADEALQLGMLDRVVEPAQFQQSARALTQELASLPTVAIGYIKRNLQVAERGSLADVLDAESVHMARTFETEDHREAVRAHVERRAATFTGR